MLIVAPGDALVCAMADALGGQRAPDATLAHILTMARRVHPSRAGRRLEILDAWFVSLL